MRKYGKQIKKVMVFLLLLTMTVTTVQPFSVSAVGQPEESAENLGTEAVPKDQVSEDGQGNAGSAASVTGAEKPDAGTDVPVQDGFADVNQEQSDPKGEGNSASKPTVTSLLLERDGQDVNGHEVKDGDTVRITVEAKSSSEFLPEQKSGSVTFRSGNKSSAVREVPLVFKEEDGNYQGTLEIQGMESGEWYIENINIDGSEADDTAVAENGSCYIQVRSDNEDISTESETDVTINFYAKDEEGKSVVISSVKKKMKRGQTLKDMGITFPEMKSIYPGQTKLTQTGWVNGQGEAVTEDTPLEPGKSFWVGTPDIPGGWFEYVNIYAKYDKEVVSVIYTYPDREGHGVEAVRPIIYEDGATYGEILRKAQFTPEDMTKEYPFEKWELRDMSLEENEIADSRSFLRLTLGAKFSGMVYLNVNRIYYDRKGSTKHGSESVFVKEGTSINKAIEDILNQPEPPETYPGLRFQKWKGYDGDISVDDCAVRNGRNLPIYAVYENCMIRYILNGTGTEEGTIFCQTAEKGERVTALKSFQGFGKVTWKNGGPSPDFVADGDMTFYGTAERVSDPAKPAEPSGTSGNGSTTSGTDNAPDSSLDNRLSDAETEQIVQTINKAASGASFRINMGTATIVSKEILEAAKGKDVTLVLEMEGYSWTIKGTDIAAQRLQDIDLRVIKDTDHIPDATVQALAGGRPSMQISLAYDGIFGFQATLNIGIGTEYSGGYGNLFYYNGAGKMEFINAGIIDGAGNAALIFSHASDYLIVVSDQMMSQAEVPGDLNPAGTAGQSSAGNLSASGAGGGKSVRTGDSSSLWIWLLAGMSAMGILICFLKRKEDRI